MLNPQGQVWELRRTGGEVLILQRQVWEPKSTGEKVLKSQGQDWRPRRTGEAMLNPQGQGWESRRTPGEMPILERQVWEFRRTGDVMTNAEKKNINKENAKTQLRRVPQCLLCMMTQPAWQNPLPGIMQSPGKRPWTRRWPLNWKTGRRR
jgi:hypothetical protein